MGFSGIPPGASPIMTLNKLSPKPFHSPCLVLKVLRVSRNFLLMNNLSNDFSQYVYLQREVVLGIQNLSPEKRPIYEDCQRDAQDKIHGFSPEKRFIVYQAFEALRRPTEQELNQLNIYVLVYNEILALCDKAYLVVFPDCKEKEWSQGLRKAFLHFFLEL